MGFNTKILISAIAVGFIGVGFSFIHELYPYRSDTFMLCFLSVIAIGVVIKIYKEL